MFGSVRTNTYICTVLNVDGRTTIANKMNTATLETGQVAIVLYEQEARTLSGILKGKILELERFKKQTTEYMEVQGDLYSVNMNVNQNFNHLINEQIKETVKLKIKIDEIIGQLELEY